MTVYDAVRWEVNIAEDKSLVLTIVSNNASIVLSAGSNSWDELDWMIGNLPETIAYISDQHNKSEAAKNDLPQ